MDHRSVTGESKWNSKRRRLVLRVFNSTTDRGYGTLDAAGLGNAVSASALTLAGSDNGGGRSESFIGRLVAGDCESSPFYRRSELTGQPGTTFCNKQPQKSTGTLKNTRIDSNAWWGDDRRRNDGILCESRLLRLNSSGNGGGNNNNVPSRSYNLPTERDGRVGLIGSNSDFRKGNLKRNSLPDKYWNSGRILGYLDNVKFRNNEINKTHADRKKVTDLQFDPLFLPRLNGLDRDLDPRGVAVALDEGGQFSYYYVPDRFVSRDRSRDRVTMDSFPPPTPEDLKFLSAKHFLRKLKKEKQEVDLLRRKYGEPEEEGGTGVPEVDSKAHDDRLGTASTGSTGSTATVYLIRTVKKSSLGPNGGNRPNHHGNGGKVNDLEHSMPYKRRNVGNNLRREIVLEPVQIARNDGDRRKPGEGQARDTVEGQQARTRTTKTKRVKDSTAQTNDLYSTERYAEVSAVPMKVIVPRRPKRTIGLQTAANQSELFDDDDATVTSSSGRRSIGVQTTSHPIVSKTSTETQTTDGDDVTRRRHQKRTRDFGVQTETDSKEIEETEKTVTSQERERRTSNVPDAPLVDLSMASDVTTNTKIDDLPQHSLPEQAIGLTESQDMTFYTLQHEVRLLRHENYFLRQQLDYPIKPKGKLQKQNEAKILQIIRRLESKGSKGKMTPQIRDEMINETMIENEILRSENSGLQAALDQSQRQQEQLTLENDVLKKKLDILQQSADKTERQLSTVA